MRAAADKHLVRVAACQVSLRVGEVARNRATAMAAIDEAAADGARIVILPELTPSGYVFRDPAEARSTAEPADGPTVTQWADVAARRGLIIVGGFNELGDDGLLYNSAVLADPDGVRAIYRKAHLWDAESDFFVAGTSAPPVIATEFGRIAMMICYDVEFPEWVRLPALAGADLLAVPTNWPAEPVPPGERPMVVANVQAAAFANRMFIAAACRCGTERDVSWVGGSLIAGPDGYPLAGPADYSQADSQDGYPQEDSSPGGSSPADHGAADPAGLPKPETLIADCDLMQARTKATSARNDPHRDRQPALYA